MAANCQDAGICVCGCHQCTYGGHACILGGHRSGCHLGCSLPLTPKQKDALKDPNRLRKTRDKREKKRLEQEAERKRLGKRKR